MQRRHAVGSGLLAVFTLGLLACGGTSQETNTAKPAAKPAASAAPAAAKGEFGVPECDDYLNKYAACLDGKVPEAARAGVRQNLDLTRAAWKQAAATPEGRQGMAMVCKQATETAKTVMQAYGCTW